jgi:ABC-type polysaccharide/polyol phosphate export permease
MIDLCRTLFQNRRLLKELVVRDLKARYVGSSMGFFWSVIFPIINLFVYMFVFRIVLKVRFADNASPADVAIWMLAGIVVWGAFAETLTRATNSLVENANLIQKVVFPASVLPVYLTISSLINMAIGLPIVLAGVAYFGYFSGDAVVVEEEAKPAGQIEQVVIEGSTNDRWSRCPKGNFEEILVCPNDGSPLDVFLRGEVEILEERPSKPLQLGIALLAIPLLLLLQGLFTVGLGLFLSAFNLILRDTIHMVGVFVVVWMFGTPIFYPAIMVEEGNDGKYAWLLDINPMHWLINSYREVLLFNSWPDPILLLQFTVAAFVTFWAGATFFRSQRDRLPDLL